MKPSEKIKIETERRLKELRDAGITMFPGQILYQINLEELIRYLDELYDRGKL